MIANIPVHDSIRLDNDKRKNLFSEKYSCDTSAYCSQKCVAEILGCNGCFSVSQRFHGSDLGSLFLHHSCHRGKTDQSRYKESAIIEIVMLSAAALILLLTRTDGMKATQGSVFPAGMQAVIAIFGIAWMGDTFLQGNMLQLTQSIEGVVRQMPWLFGIALFAMSILLYSQAATVRALMPLGIALSISPMILVALFPAVNGYFFIPNYPTVVAAINFDRTGTTRIGKYVLNHSFMLPGLVSTGVAIGLGLLFIRIF